MASQASAGRLTPEPSRRPVSLPLRPRSEQAGFLQHLPPLTPPTTPSPDPRRRGIYYGSTPDALNRAPGSPVPSATPPASQLHPTMRLLQRRHSARAAGAKPPSYAHFLHRLSSFALPSSSAAKAEAKEAASPRPSSGFRHVRQPTILSASRSQGFPGPRRPPPTSPRVSVSRSQPALGRPPGPRRLDSIQEEKQSKGGAAPAPMSAKASPGGSVGSGTSGDSSSSPPPSLLNNNSIGAKREAANLATFDSEDVVWGADGSVVGGSLRALLKRLVPGREEPGAGTESASLLFPFLLNARAMVAPADLLAQVLQECLFTQNARPQHYERRARTNFHLGVLRLCRDWAELFPWDFRQEEMRRRLGDLLAIPFSADPATQAQSKAILQGLASKLGKLERYEAALASIAREADVAVQASQSLVSFVALAQSPRRIAEQLTHIELERLSMIGPEEFIATLSEKSPRPGATANVQHYVDWFNRLAHLVSTDICRHQRRKHRVRALATWVEVGKECLGIGNFNSLCAIVAALKSTPVSRLRRTWAGVDGARLGVLSHQLDPSSNFSSYRATLKAAQWRSEGASSPAQRIVVPFFSLFVKDLLVLHTKAAARLPNGHVNFAMWRQLGLAVSDFLAWKTVACPFERHSALLHHLLTEPVWADEKALALASYEVEAPDNSAEKEQFKALKLELGKRD